MMGAVWCFCSHSVTANLELLDSAAKEEPTGVWVGIVHKRQNS